MADPGLVSVMFTDIEGSTRLWEDDAEVMAGVLAEHDRLLGGAIEAHRGRVFSTAGDSFAAVFPTAEEAIEAAVDAQLAIRDLVVAGEPVRVRMALHSGAVEKRDEGLFGPVLNRCGRLRDAAHGGQVVVSEATEGLLGGRLPAEVSLRDLGEHRLRDLSRPQRVFQLCHPDLEAEFPPLRSLGGVSVTLPVQVTSFVGRVGESAELERLIGSSRLVTVVGAGGCGKSRLAVQVGAEVMDEFSDGVCLVELAPLADPDLLASTVASAVGVRELSGLPIRDALAGYLRSRRLLLILDNCEHLIDAAADLVAHLLSQTPDLRVVVTSREPLHIRGEAVYHLPTLPVPELGSDREQVTRGDAVQLFIDRAEAAHPGFRLTDANVTAVAEICAHLDGLPLAVELAASTSRVLRPDQISQRLDERFRLLTGGARDDVDHHRTLEAAIDWSYQLLTPDQQHTFVRLGMFAGAFSVDAAEAVCADDENAGVRILEGIVQLADRSLLEVDDTGPEVRYRMLETIRNFATARFGELPMTVQRDLAERHCRYFLSIAEPASEGPISTATTWPAELDAATPDIRQALTWATTTGHDQYAVDLAGALGWYWHLRLRLDEARHWFHTVPLHSPTVAVPSRIRALCFAAHFLVGTGAGEAIDVDTARDLAEEALDLARQTGDPALMADSLHQVGAIAFSTGDPQTVPVLEEGLELAKLAGDLWGQANIRHYLALHYRDIGFRDHDVASFDLATALFEENLQLLHELGDERLAGFTLGFLGTIAYRQGDLDKAYRLGAESLEIGRRLDDLGVIGNALQSLGQATYLRGDLESARALHQEMADREWRRLGRDDAMSVESLGIVAYAQGDQVAARDYFRRALIPRSGQPDVWEQRVLARVLWGLGRVFARDGKPLTAAALFAAVEAAATDLGDPWFEYSDEPADYQQCVALVEDALAPSELQQAQQRGSAMTLDDAADYALELLSKPELS